MIRTLVSYHYYKDADLDQLVSDLGGDVDLFADSGAYSAATCGATIDLDAYAAWLLRWRHLISVQSNLDVIGDHLATAENYERLCATGCTPLPVFHTNEPWSVLEQLCSQHRYVALGGLVTYLKGSQRQVMSWLIKAFRIGAAHGTVFHGFGVTSAGLACSLPFYSLDSSSYTAGPRFGVTYLWNDRTLKMTNVAFRDRAEVRRKAPLLIKHGIDPGRVLDPGFMRGDSPDYHDDRALVVMSSARAFQLMERSLVERHAVPAPELPRFGEVGTKIYLTMSGNDVDIVSLQRLVTEGIRT